MPTLGGFGVIAEGDIDNHGGPEISFFYLRQFYSIQENGQILDTIGKRIYVLAGYRHWFTSQLSAQAGFYSSYSMGDAKIYRSEFPNGGEPKTSASDETDYGFEASLLAEWPLSARMALTTDFRFSRSVTAKPGESVDFYGGVLAVKFFIQGREKPPK